MRWSDFEHYFILKWLPPFSIGFAWILNQK